MLLNMHIKNIALIDEIDISFEDKLNILTGETGAGKSIIIGSLGICLGGKFPKEILRDNTRDGVVELLFTIDNEYIRNKLIDIDIDPGDDNEVLISRRLNSSGRTVSRINDNTVTTAKLKETASILVDLHAQHEQQTLLKPAKHLEILDLFGGDDISSIKSEVASIYKEYTAIKSKLESDALDEAEKNKQMDFLKYQINEINSANLKSGEDEELETHYKKAVNSKEILATADEIYKVTGYKTPDSCSERIGHALQQMRKLSELDSDMTDIYSLLEDVDGILNDFNRELSQYMKGLEFDKAEFSELETRLDLINGLKSKYGNSIEEIMGSCINFENEYDHLVSYDEYMKELKAEFNDVSTRLEQKSNELTECRVNSSKRMCEIIKNSLTELNFMSVEFDMKFNKLDKFSANGNDEAIFMISTNVGESIRPLYEVASGGELSRVMLALKSCMAYEDDTPTLVFDEIDVGISGRTAQKVAEKMSIIGRQHQVICITHLPQIAAMADTHYIIEKNVEKNKTVTNIRKLDSKEETDEIARLLGGAEITKATILSAKEMKGLADRTKIY